MARKTKEQKEIESLKFEVERLEDCLENQKLLHGMKMDKVFEKRVVDGVVAELVQASQKLHKDTLERGQGLILMGYPKDKLPSSLKVCFCIAEHLMKIAEQQAGHPLSIPVE